VTESSSSSSFASGNRLLYVGIACLSVLGMVVSAISLQRHYAKSVTRFCEVGEKFNCDIVNRSEYSSVIGIPVAGIGVAGYALLFVLATIYRSSRQTPARLLAAAAAGLAFALYLTYIEGYVLETWCILCLTSLAAISAITLLAGILKMTS
jgi:vitamin-K-epoxide reductase (warfarin-sensitive)